MEPDFPNNAIASLSPWLVFLALEVAFILPSTAFGRVYDGRPTVEWQEKVTVL